jgi:hypothetical protein
MMFGNARTVQISENLILFFCNINKEINFAGSVLSYNIESFDMIFPASLLEIVVIKHFSGLLLQAHFTLSAILLE